jgi:hypothetical protein
MCQLNINNMALELINPVDKMQLDFKNDGLYSDNKIIFPWFNGAYRIVKESNYTESFGYQWNKFVRTQIDSNETALSRVRFFAETNLDKGTKCALETNYCKARQ